MGYQNERLNSDRLEMMKKEIDFKGLRVLDLGCAEGYFSREIKKLGAEQVIGICDSLHDEAVAMAEAENLDIEFIAGDFMKADFMIRFDCVLFLSLLHYFHTREAKIEALEKVSQHAGRYAFFEFEEGLNHPGHCSFGEFCEMIIKPSINFKTIKFLGISDKMDRKIILCEK